ncbi:MAG: N-acetyl-gamma-glutamyl-phosphate reductase [Peptostreptococcales bacterium]
MIRVGIIGATGYAGAELVKLLHDHPEVQLSFLCSNSYSSQKFSDIYPHFKYRIDQVLIDTESALSEMRNIDVLFTALPHGTSFPFAKEALKNNVKFIDLGADFRLHDGDTFEAWYQVRHEAREFLSKSVYGLPELHKEAIKNTDILANPGCYTTASILALYPALKEKLIDPQSIIIDAKSGVTGAGRKADISLLLTECSESIKAYSIGSHRHTPEIEQELSLAAGKSIALTFTPHLIPMQRGILATCYGTISPSYMDFIENSASSYGYQDSYEQLLQRIYELYYDFYKDAAFVRVRDDVLETRFVKDTNYCDISIRIDSRTHRLIITSALDNLVKGASGQAIQNMNIMFGLDEKIGLEG